MIRAGTWFTIAFLFMSLASCSTAPELDTSRLSMLGTTQGGQSQANRATTSAALQKELMSFADGFVIAIGNVCDQLLSKADTPEERVYIQNRKLTNATAAFINASGSSPEISLLDMLVLVILGRETLEDYGIPEVLGEKGKILLDTYYRQEQEIRDLSKRVLTVAQLQELDELINKWRQKYPEQKVVSMVHFNDFAELRGRKSTAKKKRERASLFGYLFI
ncbi:MAG: hypothetical protein V3T77_02235, partial [Planctomycetota bacterium]